MGRNTGITWYRKFKKFLVPCLLLSSRNTQLSSASFNHKHVLPLSLKSTKSYLTGFRACGQALDSIISQTAGWQPTSPSLTWPPPWPLPNVINIPNQWGKQGGSGQGCEHDLLVGFKRPVILCLHLILTLFLWSAKVSCGGFNPRCAFKLKL